MISIAFPKEQRGVALGIMASIGTTFLALGPLVGGFFTEMVSWRWIFWINVPIVALISLVICVAWVDPPKHTNPSRFDFAGLLALVAGLSMLVFAIMQGPTWGWTQGRVPWLLSGSIVVLLLFILIERRGTAPLINVDLFSIGSFSASSLILFVGQFCKISIVVFSALYLQDQLAMGPLDTGVALLVSVVAFPFLSMPAGKFADKHGARTPVIGGLALATLGMFWVGAVSPENNYWLLFPGLVIWGIGMSCCYSPTLRAMANSVPAEKQGQIGGIGATSRLLGGTLGMALCITVYTSTQSYQNVFYLTAAIMLAALVVGWFTITGQEA